MQVKKLTVEDIRLWAEEDAEMLEENCHEVVDFLLFKIDELTGILHDIRSEFHAGE